MARPDVPEIKRNPPPATAKAGSVDIPSPELVVKKLASATAVISPVFEPCPSPKLSSISVVVIICPKVGAANIATATPAQSESMQLNRLIFITLSLSIVEGSWLNEASTNLIQCLKM